MLHHLPDKTPEGVPVPHFEPYRPQRYRAHGWTPETQQAFIYELTRIGSVSMAAKAVGRTTRSAYLLREKPGAESFAAAWAVALAEGVEHAAQRAIERAIHGDIVPTFRRGRMTGFRVVRHDGLLCAVLSARRKAFDEDGWDELDEHRYRLEKWEAMLRRESFDRIEHTQERRAEAAREAAELRAWEKELAREKRRQLAADIRGKVRGTFAPKPPAPPRVRVL